MQGKVEKYINEKVESQGALLLSLIDPDKQSLENGAKVAKLSCEAGADVILIGGSIGAQGEEFDKTTKMIKENVNVPVVVFPGNIGAVTPNADALYFMYMLNSKDVYWLSTAQIQAAPVVKKLGIEPIPTAYIVLEPGMAVGWVGNANLVPRSRPDLAAACALAGQYMGARLIVTDSGSGAPSPAPLELISAVSKAVDVPYFYAGGVKTAQQAGDIIKAGASGVQVGTAFEIDNNIFEKVSAMKKAVLSAAKARV